MLLALGFISFSLYQAERTEPEPQKVTIPPSLKEAPARPEHKPIKRVLVPADPADYGMVVTEFSTLDQSQWDMIVAQKLRETRDRYTEDQRKKIKEFIKEDPEKTREKLKKIDEKMRLYQDELSKDPGNEELKGAIERLKMLKSIARELPNI